MAEFCLKCFNKMEDKRFDCSDVVLSHSVALCEGCGEMRRTVIRVRHPRSPLRWFGRLQKK